MKNLLINILWYLLNRLDKQNIKITKIGDEEITYKLSKNYFRKNEWTNLALTLDYWIRFEDNKTKPIVFENIKIYSNAKKKKEIKQLLK